MACANGCCWPVRDGRLHTDDIQALANLVRRRFSPARLAGDWWQQLSL